MIILAEKLAGQNSAYRHRKYEGRFRKRRRPSPFHEGREIAFLVKRQCFAWLEDVDMAPLRSSLPGKILTTFGLQFP